MSQWFEYEPTSLVEAAKERATEYPWLEAALKQCTSAMMESELYIYFIDPSEYRSRGGTKDHQQSITLFDTDHGCVEVDIVKPNIVAGIELLDKVLGRKS
ncbi:MAG: hypothetical protein AAGB19_23195 [Cyanobacteria bacterium P01_F01_bin.3]